MTKSTVSIFDTLCFVALTSCPTPKFVHICELATVSVVFAQNVVNIYIWIPDNKSNLKKLLPRLLKTQQIYFGAFCVICRICI